MLEKKYWPFDTLPVAEQTDQHRREIAFLKSAFDAGHRSFMDTFGFGASSDNGRAGDIVRRGGRGRYWEIVFEENDKIAGRVFVDGFEPAAAAVLSWIGGEDCSTALVAIQDAIIKKPGERGW
ncbi:MAG TPA: hypothetical protein VHY91_23610 [Pirellulales bacterium]|nr:hypothetical protein [Pirellulales bacterium]